MDLSDFASTPSSARPSVPADTSRGLALGLKILTYLRNEGRAFTLGELAAYTRLGKPSLLRLLRTLEGMGYVSRDADRSYRIEVESSVTGTSESLRVLRHAWGRFSQEIQSHCGETVSLAYLFEDHIRVVDVLESPQHIRMANFVGRILQPYASSLAKAITAFQDEALIQTLIDVYGIYRATKYTLVDQLAIQNEFALVRARGYAEDKEETVEGGYCLGAPIRNPDGRVIAALSVSSPKFRVTADFIQNFPARLIETADNITRALAEELRSRHPAAPPESPDDQPARAQASQAK
jgi:IclR family acetate operon transcriptional repressor